MARPSRAARSRPWRRTCSTVRNTASRITPAVGTPRIFPLELPSGLFDVRSQDLVAALAQMLEIALISQQIAHLYEGQRTFVLGQRTARRGKPHLVQLLGQIRWQ